MIRNEYDLIEEALEVYRSLGVEEQEKYRHELEVEYKMKVMLENERKQYLDLIKALKDEKQQWWQRWYWGVAVGLGIAGLLVSIAVMVK